MINSNAVGIFIALFILVICIGMLFAKNSIFWFIFAIIDILIFILFLDSFVSEKIKNEK